MSSKLNAFTILEVTIAMLLAGISISIAYTAYRMIGRSYQEYDTKNERLAESMLLDRLLKSDFATAQEIKASNEGLVLKYGETKIWYLFRFDYILRDQAGLRKDTSFVKPSNLRTSFMGQDVFSGQLADKLSFSTSLAGKEIEHQYTRQYSAGELMLLGK